MTLRQQYEINPKTCLTCGEKISSRSSNLYDIRDALKRKYCSKSCAAKNNNKLFPKRKRPKCEQCGLPCRKNICASCYKKLRRETSRKQTKGELLKRVDSRGRWDIYRAQLAKHARTAYIESGKPKNCFVCGYTHHIHVAHIRAVSSFPNESTLGEINAIDNLIALCPNHHWEFDAGLLKIGCAAGS